MPEEDDQKVKDLLGSATREDLERWFGLPSYEQLADEGVVPPEVAEQEDARATARAAALAAADPAFFEAKFALGDAFATVITEPPPWELAIAEDGIALFDERISAKLSAVDPREYDLPEHIANYMQENTPQALLRDLHRPETSFDKWFQLVDMAAAQRMDIVAVIAKALRENYHVTLDAELPAVGVLRDLRAVRAERRESWLDHPAHQKAMAAKLSPDDAQSVQAEAAMWTSMSAGSGGDT